LNCFGHQLFATFDERSFRAVKPLCGGNFAVLPADAE